jgi:adenosine deaminase
MLSRFSLFLPLVSGSAASLRRAAIDFARRQRDANCVYSEVRFSPHLLCSSDESNAALPKLTPREVLEAVAGGLREGCAEHGVHVNIILCCICFRPDWSADLATLAIARHREQEAEEGGAVSWEGHVRRCDARDAQFSGNVVGVDVAAGEEHFFPDKFPELHKAHVEAMRRCKEAGLGVTVHAGEVTSGSEVRSAVEVYGASRIGHGYRAAEDAGALEYLRGRGVHVEVCPTSSYETGGWTGEGADGADWGAHPIARMAGVRPCGGGGRVEGVSVGLNSDDPAVFNTDLNREFEIAKGGIGLPFERVKRTVMDSLDAAFLHGKRGEFLRKYLKDKIEKEMAAITYVDA